METFVSSTTKLVFKAANVAVDDVGNLELSWREPGDQIHALEAAIRLRSRLDAFVCDLAAEIDRTGTAKDAGYRNTAQLVSDRTGADGAQTRSDVRLGRWLADFAELGDAFESGEILRDHLELLRKSVDGPRTHQQLQQEQQQFIEWASDYDFVDFERICQYWVNANDPDGAEPKDQIKATSFRASERPDGTVKVSGHLDPLTGAAFMTAFNHEDQKLFRSTQADDAAPASNAKRGADALMNLVTRGFQRQDGTYPTPLITIVASEAVVEDTIARLDEPSVEPLPLDFTDIDKRCELINGTPLHPSYLLATLGLATFRRQIVNAKGRSIDVSVNARCFTPWQQQALRVEARGRCQDRGCDSPFPWLEADHRTPHSRGGPTQMGNGTMRCGPHNKAKGDRPEPSPPGS